MQALDLVVQKADVEPRVVSHEHAVAGEVEEAGDCGPGCRRSPEVGVGEARQRRNTGREGHGRIDEGLERSRKLEPANSDGADLADPCTARGETGRLEVDDHEGGRLERERGELGAGEPDRAATPIEARVGGHDVRQQIVRQPGRCPGECEQRSGRLLDREDSPLLFHQLHEPVGGVQPELHGSSLDERMFVLNETRRSAVETP